MISGISAAFHAARDHLKKRIAAKFKSRDVRVLADPEKQVRSPSPVSSPSSGQTHLGERKVDEAVPSEKPYLYSPQPDSQTEDREPRTELPRPQQPKTNPLKYFTSEKPDDSEEDDQSQTLKDTLAKLGFELSELKRDAWRLRNKTRLQQYQTLEQALQTQPPETVLTLLKELQSPSLSYHIPIIEKHLATTDQETPARPLTTLGDDEDIPDIPDDIQPRAVQHFSNGNINMVIGDITRLKQDHDIPVEAIISPAGGLGELSPARKQVLAAEPLMATPEFQKRLGELESGRSALMPATKLAEQGVKYIVHPVTPRPGEPEPQNLLLASYLMAISQAIQKGATSLALPVIGDEGQGLNPENACKLALGTVMHCLRALPKGQAAPKIYFVFPDQPEYLPQIESMEQTLEEIPDKPPSSRESIENELPVLQLSNKYTLRLMAKILPSGHAFTTRGKIKWMNKEIEQLCKMMYLGEFNLERYDRITGYLHNAQMKMYDLVETGDIRPSECMLLNDYFEKRIEMLEIYERKYGKAVSRKVMSRDVDKYNAGSRFATCPPPVKIAFVNNFDGYCEQVFKAHHLRAVAADKTEKKAGKIARPVHGVMHASRTALWVKALIHLYQKHGDPEALQIREEEIPMIQMAAICNSCSAHANRQESELENSRLCRQALMDEGVDEVTADHISSAIPGKNKRYTRPGTKDILEKVLHDAVALEKLRYCETFQLEQELDFVKVFEGQGLAMDDIKKMTGDVASTIHRQHDMMRAPVMSLEGTPLPFDQQPSFNARQKERWEHTEHPYSAMEVSVEKHHRFLEEMLIDS